MKLLKLLSFCLLLIAIGTSCTRKVDATNAISIDGKVFQNKIDTASGQMPMFVMFNLHFEGKTEVAQWECQAMRDDQLQDTAKFTACWNELQFMEFDFNGKEFPSGVPMLLQLLVVMYVPSNEGFSFEYIDRSLNLASGTNRHVLRFGDFQTVGSSAGTAEVKGRFVDLAGDPQLGTGLVIGEIKPKADKPSMRLFKNAIYDGWFSFFMLDGLPITYRLVDPINPDNTLKTLFDAKSLNDIEASIDASKAARVFSIPTHFEIDQRDFGWESRKREAKKFVAGYFNSNTGPEATGTYQLDFPVADHSYSDLHYNSDGNDPLVDSTSSTLRANSFQLTYDVDSGSPDFVRITSGATSPSGCYSSGDFVQANCMKINHDSILENDGLIYGPFQESDAGKLISSTELGSVHTLTWKYLPGVNSKLSGTAVFSVPRYVSEMLRQTTGDGIACRKLAAISGAVSNVAVEALEAHEQGIQIFQADSLAIATTSIAIDASNFPSTGEDVNVYVCPYFTHASGKNIFLDEAAEYRIHSGGSTGGSMATKFRITQVFPSPNINQATCTPIIVESVDDSGNHAELPSLGSFTLTATDGTFYSHADCASSISSITIDETYGFHQVVYVQTASGSGTTTLDVTPAGGLVSMGTESLSLNITSGLAATSIGHTIDLSDIYLHNCHEFFVANLDMNGAVVQQSKSYTIASSPANGVYYSTYNDCMTNGSATSAFGLGTFDSKRLYYKPATTTPTSLDITATSLTDSNNAVTPSAPGSAFAVYGHVMKNYSLTTPVIHSGFCHKVELHLKDSSHKYTESGMPENVTVSLNDTDIYLYPSGSDCEYDTSRILNGSTYSFAANTSVAELYVRVGTSGNHSIDLNLNSSGESRQIDFEVDPTFVDLILLSSTMTCHDFRPYFRSSFSEEISSLDTNAMLTSAGSGLLSGMLDIDSGSGNTWHLGAGCVSSNGTNLSVPIYLDSDITTPVTYSIDKATANPTSFTVTPFGISSGSFPW
jgi:hypothetical protein